MSNLARDPPLDIMIRKLSKSLVTPDKKKMRVIDLESVRLIASKKEVTRWEAEAFCLESDVVPVRYLRNIGTIGVEGQLKLLRSTVAVCGAGGLGGTIIELLARQGIGHLVIIDNDRFAENNLNRQILVTESDLRKPKVNVAAVRVKKINSAVVISVCLLYTSDAADEEDSV